MNLLVMWIQALLLQQILHFFVIVLATIAGVFSLAAHAITITTENESTAVG